MLTLKKIYTFFFFLGLFFIPFNEFDGISLLGEYQAEAAIYFFLVAYFFVICETVLQKKIKVPYENIFFKIIVLLLAIILLVFLFRFGEIKDNYFKQTNGVSRFLRQYISFGIMAIMLTHLFWNVVEGLNVNVLFKRVRRVFLYSLLFVFVYGFIEILIVFRGLHFLMPVLELFDYFPFVNTHLAVERVAISSITFEVPALGNYLIMVTGWMLSYILTERSYKRFLPIGMVLILMFFSDSRTAFICIIIQLIVFFVLLISWEKYRENTLAFIKFGGIFIFSALVFKSNAILPKIEDKVDRINFFQNLTKDVSNKSRFGMQKASLEVFKDYPVFGVGLGQDTYYKRKYYPYWATVNNWEYKYWYKNQKIKSFPPAYNMYTRLLSETGIVGTLLFVSLLLLTLYYSFKHFLRLPGDNKYIALILIVSFSGLIVNWLQMDFFRQYGFWLCLILLIKLNYSVVPNKISCEN